MHGADDQVTYLVQRRTGRTVIGPPPPGREAAEPNQAFDRACDDVLRVRVEPVVELGRDAAVHELAEGEQPRPRRGGLSGGCGAVEIKAVEPGKAFHRFHQVPRHPLEDLGVDNPDMRMRRRRRRRRAVVPGRRDGLMSPDDRGLGLLPGSGHAHGVREEVLRDGRLLLLGVGRERREGLIRKRGRQVHGARGVRLLALNPPVFIPAAAEAPRLRGGGLAVRRAWRAAGRGASDPAVS